MTLVADESVDRPIIEELRRAGHNVVAIAEILPRAEDASVPAMARGLRAFRVLRLPGHGLTL